MASNKPSKKVQSNSPGLIRIGLGVAISLAALFFIYSRSFNFIQDDAYITFRYIKNFTEGNGLVFNIGEYVEGYTCFLWVMILSLIKKVGLNFISSSQILGVLSGCLMIVFTYKISSEIFNKEGKSYNFIFSLIAPMLLATNGSFAYWANSGMETALFGFLVTLAVYLYLKELNSPKTKFEYSSLVFLLAAMTRPEGVLIFIVALVHKAIRTFKSENADRKTVRKKFLVWLSVFLIPGLLFMVWRYSYYGFLLPNTFYAKTGTNIEYFHTGFNYVWEFFKSYGLYGALLIVALFASANKKYKSELLFLSILFFVFCVYIISVGGDVLHANRFFVPMLPVFYILVQEGMHVLLSRFEKPKLKKYAHILTLTLTLVFCYMTYNREYEQIKKFSVYEKGLTDKMKITAEWLKKKQDASGRKLVVGATTIGALSYFSDVTLIDMLGLTDKEVAHNPKPIPEISSTEIGWKERQYNVEYILSRKPDYIYFSTERKPSAYAERGLYTEEEFLKYYYPSFFTVREDEFTSCIYQRKSENEVRTYVSPPPNPNYKKSYVNLFNQAINTSRDANKTQEAIALFLQTLDQAPSNFSAPYQFIGELYLPTKEKVKAYDYFKKAIEIDDYNVLAHYNMYEYYMQRMDTANARISFEKIVKYSPDMIR